MAPPSPNRYARVARSEQELLDGGNHLLYETQMFFNLAALLDDREHWIRISSGWQGQTIYQACVEALLVHRRSLMDFFFPRPGYETNHRHEDDVFAGDFCDVWSPDRPDELKDESNAISEQIIHMTYRRPEGAAAWPYAAMRDSMQTAITAFIAAADDRLHPLVKAQLEAIAGRDRRNSRAVTPQVLSEHAIDRKLLSGHASGLSTPTSTATPPSLYDAEHCNTSGSP